MRAVIHEHTPVVRIEFEGAPKERLGFVELPERVEGARHHQDETHFARGDLQAAPAGFDGLPPVIFARRGLLRHFREGGGAVAEAKVEFDISRIAPEALPCQLRGPFRDLRLFQ